MLELKNLLKKKYLVNIILCLIVVFLLFRRQENFASDLSSVMKNYMINIDWILPDFQLFKQSDKETIKTKVQFSDDSINGLLADGHTQDSPSGTTFGMWNNKGGIHNYFEDVYKKIGCCTGQDTVNIKIPIKQDDGSYKVEEHTIDIDRSKCKFNDIDMDDNNMDGNGYKQDCQYFFERLIAFLEMYDPENPLIATYGGCLSNKFIPDEIKNDPSLFGMYDANRKCTVPECADKAYKRNEERSDCNTVICNATIDLSNVSVQGSANITDNTIVQNCGKDTPMGKELEKKKNADAAGVGVNIDEITSNALNATSDGTSNGTSSGSAATDALAPKADLSTIPAGTSPTTLAAVKAAAASGGTPVTLDTGAVQELASKGDYKNALALIPTKIKLGVAAAGGVLLLIIIIKVVT